MKNIFFQSVKCFHYKAVGESEIQSNMAAAVEGAAVLPDYAHLYTGALQSFDIGVILPAPFRTVQEEHVSSLRHGSLYPLKMTVDKRNGIFQISV